MSNILKWYEIVERLLAEQQRAVRQYLDNPSEYNRGCVDGVKSVKDSILAYIDLKGKEE